MQKRGLFRLLVLLTGSVYCSSSLYADLISPSKKSCRSFFKSLIGFKNAVHPDNHVLTIQNCSENLTNHASTDSLSAMRNIQNQEELQVIKFTHQHLSFLALDRYKCSNDDTIKLEEISAKFQDKIKNRDRIISQSEFYNCKKKASNEVDSNW